MTEKAVILARGLGTRMRRDCADVTLGDEGRSMAERGLKALMPLNGRPFVDYIVDSLLRAGLRRICFVIAPDGDLMRQHALRIGEAAGVDLRCVVQEEPRGTADAVLAAEEFVGGDPFVLSNGDDLYPDEALADLAGVTGSACALVAFDADGLACYGNIPRERIAGFAVVRSSADGDLLEIVEKPADPLRYAVNGRLWVSMNLYRFTADIFDSCRRVQPDPARGELELTAAVGEMLRAGTPPFRVLRCEGGIFDLTSRADVPAAEAALQERVLSF